jgi:uncharacterized membrane protein YeaQ/YmgE (transglycosylase-associated protein family)
MDPSGAAIRLVYRTTSLEGGNRTMGLVSWLVAGVVVALLTHRLLPGRFPRGVADSLIAGVLGAVLAGLVFALGMGQSVRAFNVTTLVGASLGALVVTGLFRLAAGNPGRRNTSAPKRS